MKHLISVKTFANGIMSVNEFKTSGLAVSEVAGIAIQTETIGLIVALEEWELPWGSDDICVDVKDEDDYIGEAKALMELCGLEATKRIIEKNQDYNEGEYAAKRCFDYGCANLQWYLPSLYELGTVCAYQDEINAILDELGLPNAKLDASCRWSSSESYQNIAWYVYFSNGYFNYGGKCYSYVVRAVCALEPLERGVLSTPSKETSSSELTDEQLCAMLRERGYNGDLTMTKTLSV